MKMFAFYRKGYCLTHTAQMVVCKLPKAFSILAKKWESGGAIIWSGEIKDLKERKGDNRLIHISAILCFFCLTFLIWQLRILSNHILAYIFISLGKCRRTDGKYVNTSQNNLYFLYDSGLQNKMDWKMWLMSTDYIIFIILWSYTFLAKMQIKAIN